ncbi:MAG TPA: AtpZ/AtpI family protein [Candidatus Bipolaricaulota bacterium]
MSPKDAGWQAALEALSLIGQLGLYTALCFGLTFAAGWALDQALHVGVFKWIGLILGVVALYWNAARVLRKYWQPPDEGPPCDPPAS